MGQLLVLRTGSVKGSTVDKIADRSEGGMHDAPILVFLCEYDK